MTTLREGVRLGARAFGARAESLAAEWLAAQGYRILARKFTIPGAEIDIVATRGDAVAFVEVKARPTLDAGLAAISRSKQRRLGRAVAVWLARNPWAAQGYALRGDAVFVDASRQPLHIEDAFTLEFEE
jgi:putative endonuclease